MLYQVEMVEISDKKLYACPYCKWVFFGTDKAEKHAHRCLANPDARSCATCCNKKLVDDVGWACTVGIINEPLFGNITITQCPRWEDCTHVKNYYTKKLEVGDEFKPKNYNRTYRVVGIVE